MQRLHKTDRLRKRRTANRTASMAVFAAGMLVSVIGSTSAVAETPLGLNTATPSHMPFSQTTPPGVYGHMQNSSRSAQTPLQAVKVVTAGEAKVTVFGSTQPAGLNLSTNETFAVQVGAVYRLKLSDIPGRPGVEVYPTIELVDRLHPPAGKAAEFPILIEITDEEINAALTDRLVTKVVYLRPRNDTSGFARTTVLPTAQINSDQNVVEAAIQRGRPVAVVRLGGRTPSGPADMQFFVGAALEYPVQR